MGYNVLKYRYGRSGREGSFEVISGKGQSTV